ncbi:587_t:CDS:2, partial [Gigaspora margarita]
QKPSNLKMPSRKNIRHAHVTNKSHHSWSIKEKLMVLCYLEHTDSVRATAKCFEIEPKQVRDWRDKKQELLNAVSYVLTLNRGQQTQYPLLEEKLVDWIEELRSMQNAITRNMVVRKAKALAQTDEIKNTYSNISSFKFSINWLINTNNEPSEEVLNLDNIDGDKYEEVEFDNIWE